MDIEYLEEYEDVLKTCQIYDSTELKQSQTRKEFEVDFVKLSKGTNNGKMNENNKAKSLSDKLTKKCINREKQDEIEENKKKSRNREKVIRNIEASDCSKLSKKNNLRKTRRNKIGKATLLNEKKNIKMKNQRRNIIKTSNLFDKLSSVRKGTEKNISGKNNIAAKYVDSLDFVDCGESYKMSQEVKTPLKLLSSIHTNLKTDTAKLKKKISLEKSIEKESKSTTVARPKSVTNTNEIFALCTENKAPLKRKSHRGINFYTDLLGARKKKSAKLDAIEHSKIKVAETPINIQDDEVIKKEKLQSKVKKISNQKMKQNKVRKLKVVLKKLKMENISKLKKVATNINTKKLEQINIISEANKNCKVDYEKITKEDEKCSKQIEDNLEKDAPKHHEVLYQKEQHKHLKDTANRIDKKNKPTKMLKKGIKEKSIKLKSSSLTITSPCTGKVISQYNQSYSESSTTSKQYQNSIMGTNNITFYEVPAYIFVETKILTRAEYQKLKSIKDVDKLNVKNEKPKSQALLSRRTDRRNLEVLLDDIEAVIDKEISKQVKEKLQRISEGFCANNEALIEHQKQRDKEAILEDLHFDADIFLKILRFLKIYFLSTANVNKEEENMKTPLQKSEDLSLNSNLSNSECSRENHLLNSETGITKISECKMTDSSRLLNNKANLSDEFKFRKIRLPHKDNLSINQKCEEGFHSTDNRNLQILPKIVSVDVTGNEEIILPDVPHQGSDDLKNNSKNISNDFTVNSSSSQSSVKSVILLPNPKMKRPFTNSTQISKYRQLQSKSKQIILQKQCLKNLSIQSNADPGKNISRPPPILAVAPIISSIEKSNERLAEDELIIPDEYIESGSKNISLAPEINSQENQNEPQSSTFATLNTLSRKQIIENSL